MITEETLSYPEDWKNIYNTSDSRERDEKELTHDYMEKMGITTSAKEKKQSLACFAISSPKGFYQTTRGA